MTERSRLPILVIAIAFLTGACAVPVVVAGLTLNDIATGFSLTSTVISGKGLGEHVLDVTTGKDCRIIEGVLRKDRQLCEERGSAATEKDFKGLYARFRENADPRQVASGAAPASAGKREAASSAVQLAATSGAEAIADRQRDDWSGPEERVALHVPMTLLHVPMTLRPTTQDSSPPYPTEGLP